MHDQAIEVQRRGAIELFAERANRAAPQRGVGGREIDQIAVVRDDRTDPAFADAAAKGRHFIGRQLARAPLAGGLGEDLQRLAAACLGPIDRARQAAGNRQVRTEAWHPIDLHRARYHRASYAKTTSRLRNCARAVRGASGPVQAWGFTAHKFIVDRAIALLPAELRPFYEKYRVTIVEHAIDPDTYRTMGFIEEPPRHFFDIDGYGPAPFKEVPHDYSEAVATRGQDFVLKNGTLPWRTMEIYGRLRDAFKQVATGQFSRDDVKLFSSVLGHYVADSFQPLHAATNYDGQLTGQQGIHSRFETELFERNQASLHIAPSPVVPIPNPTDFVFATLADSFNEVAPILAADRAAVDGRSTYDDEYFARLLAATGPILEQRVAGSITGVASMITAAWIEAGKPALPPDPPARSPRRVRGRGSM